ncbi:MAG: acylphosphatase [Gemmatimonadaceae bacterium]|nr:acylphosphatase [Gemmatimonadaceae bacterium]
MSEVLAHVEVTGQVQGVGFREFTRTIAQRLGIAGWVRNREDGAVELAASGNASQIETLLAAVRRGPAGVSVREVRALPVDAQDVMPKPFVIRR